MAVLSFIRRYKERCWTLIHCASSSSISSSCGDANTVGYNVGCLTSWRRCWRKS